MIDRPFAKMHGLGNDYVFMDDRAETIGDPAALARRVSDRHTAIGSDGLILLLRPSSAAADIRMRIFNADGSEAEMCGNGIRCLCKLAYERDICRARPMRVETASGVLTLEYNATSGDRVDMVSVDMGTPQFDPPRIPAALPAGTGPLVDRRLEELGLDEAAARAATLHRGWCALSMGNPHLVLFADDLAAVPLDVLGPALARHPLFPRKINVHVVRVDDRRTVTMRTWERGSGLTRACGTGASAVCVASVLAGATMRSIVAHLPGGDLRLEWEEATDHVTMTGPATHAFDGVWSEPRSTPDIEVVVTERTASSLSGG